MAPKSSYPPTLVFSKFLVTPSLIKKYEEEGFPLEMVDLLQLKRFPCQSMMKLLSSENLSLLVFSFCDGMLPSILNRFFCEDASVDP
jgi:hypothetical protein